MRYTEAKLTRYADVLLGELAHGTVDWTPNFDGTMEEPLMLPARLPNLLLNGTSGIAVGMATDIPPHNLREVAAACIHLLEDPEAHDRALMKHVKGPDLPTGAEIISPRADLKEFYDKGVGSFKARATYEIEDGNVVITSLPLPGVRRQRAGADRGADAREEAADGRGPARRVGPRESDAAGDRAALEPRRPGGGHEPPVCDHRPRAQLPRQPQHHRPRWPPARHGAQGPARRMARVPHRARSRAACSTGSTRSRGGCTSSKGCSIAYLNLDEVIRIIRREDEPKPVLMKRFKLSDEQAEEILNTRLRHLAQARRDEDPRGAEGARRGARGARGAADEQGEAEEARRERDPRGCGEVRRRAPHASIVEREAAQAIDETTLIPNEPVTVVLSTGGFVRSAKGHEIDPLSLSYKSGDEFQAMARGRSLQPAVFIDSTGRTYTLPAHSLPSARGQGEPLSGRLNPPDGAKFAGVMMGEPEDLWLLASDAGYGFTVRLKELITDRRAGKTVLNVPDNALVLPPALGARHRSRWWWW